VCWHFAENAGGDDPQARHSGASRNPVSCLISSRRASRLQNLDSSFRWNDEKFKTVKDTGFRLSPE
jgi:hypothetical protein